MRTITLSAILSLMMFPLASQALLWDFNDKAQEADWEVISGTCEIDGGTYKISNPAAEALAITGESDWTDYTVSCKARLTEPGGFNNIAIVLRCTDDGSSEYMFMLEGGRQQAEWWKKVNGAYTEVQTDPLEVDIEGWFSLKVDMEGSTLKGYYEGELVSAIEDGDLKEGKAGVRVYGCTSHIDDFEVSGLGIEPSPVETTGKLAATWGSLKRR